MKIRFLGTLLIFILLALPLTAAPPAGKENAAWMRAMKSTRIDNESYIDANLIFMFVTNHGNFGRDLAGVFGNDYGTYYPYTNIASIENGSNISSPLYASGLWIGGVDSASGEVRVIIAEYSDEYVPGPMQGGTFIPDRPEFRAYKLYAESLASNPNQDYLEYLQYAVAQGAPIETTITGDTIPKMIGDQMLWAVYNDADPGQHTNNSGETNPLGIEVKQTTFAFTREDALGSIVFIKLQVFNRGSNVLKDVYMSLWADPDLGGAGDDFVGCDTTLSLGFCYNADNDDQYYQATPPCLGYDFFQGPLIYTGDMADTAKMWDTLWPGYTNMGMVSFNKYINGTDPDNFQETYNYMRGLNRDGSPYVDPTTGLVTKYFLSGDPIAGTGDLDVAPADRRFMQSTGPIEFRPGDSTEILAAIVIGRGGDAKSSIAVMKYFDRFAQTAYDIDFDLPKPPAPPVVTTARLSGNIVLSWTDTSEVDPGDYPFEGYTIYQGESPSGPWKRIANFDVNNGVAQILDEVLDPITGVLETRGVKFGSDNGISRYMRIEEDFILGGDLKDANAYYYRVEAYGYDGAATPKTITSANRVPIIVEPQAPPAGIYPQAELEDVIDVQHTAGVSQGIVTPIVLDPLALTGDTYRVVFVDSMVDTTADPDTVIYFDELRWHLENVTKGTRPLAFQSNLSGDNAYLAVDGFYVKVQGPPVDFLSFDVVANANGAIDPPEGGAFDFGNFPSNRPTAAQQVTDTLYGEARWGIHTADVGGGTCNGSAYWDYEHFLSRTTRDGSNFSRIGSYDYEIRFTGSYDNPGVGGSYAIEYFNNDDNVFWVPFEVWRTGIATPNDPSDDVRMSLEIIDDGDDNTFNLESWGCPNDPLRSGGDGEHAVSGLDNDPFTDWIYFRLPSDMTPGEAGYLANEAAMLGGTYDRTLTTGEVLARVVLVNWNGHTADGDTLTNPPVFTLDYPELGTIFRLTTTKPLAVTDTFTFTTTAPVLVQAENELDKITAVPNPFYLYSKYDPSPGFNTLKFHHLPRKCDISIYNIAGDKVRTIKKDDPSAITSWDLLTERGLPVASGIYIYVVDAPGFGQKIGKVAVFTEAEVLKIY